MKKSVVIILMAALSFSMSSFAQSKPAESAKPSSPVVTQPAAPAVKADVINDSVKKTTAGDQVQAPTFSINGLTQVQLGVIYQIFAATKECLPYNKHIPDGEKINIILNIDDFSDFLNKNVKPDKIDTAKKPPSAVGKNKKSK